MAARGPRARGHHRPPRRGAWREPRDAHARRARRGRSLTRSPASPTGGCCSSTSSGRSAGEPRTARGARALRPQRLQGVQRHLRAPGRRRAAERARQPARRGCRRRPRHGLSHGRRRVLRARSPASRATASAQARARRAPRSRSAARASPSTAALGLVAASGRGDDRQRRAAARGPAHVQRQGRTAAWRPASRSPRRWRARSWSATRALGDHFGEVCRARRERGRSGSDLGAERARTGAAGRRPARRRQDRDPGRDPRQAGPARRPGVGADAQAHPVRRSASSRRRRRCATSAPIVRSSHERIDGTGYPDGLAGRDIPDRRTGHRRVRCLPRDDLAAPVPRAARPRRPRSRSSRRNAGTQFDPRVVEALRESVYELQADGVAASGDAEPANS